MSEWAGMCVSSAQLLMHGVEGFWLFSFSCRHRSMFVSGFQNVTRPEKKEVYEVCVYNSFGKAPA